MTDQSTLLTFAAAGKNGYWPSTDACH